MQECTNCRATFPLREVATPEFGTIACPVCGETSVQTVADWLASGSPSDSQPEPLPRTDVGTASAPAPTVVCLGCGASYPRRDVATPGFGEVACPECGSGDISNRSDQ